MTPDVELHFVVAADENNVIGRDGGVPWHYPDDVAQYKRRIAGHPIIVGRRTFDSMDPLPDSYSVVLTSDPSAAADTPSVEYVTSPRAAVEAAARAASATGEERGTEADAENETAATAGPAVVYVLGGAAVYELFLPYAHRIFLSRIHEHNEGDRFFPELDDAWTAVSRDDRQGFTIVEYVQDSPRPLGALPDS